MMMTASRVYVVICFMTESMTSTFFLRSVFRS